MEARNKQITLVEDAILSVFEQALDKLRSSKTEPAFLKLLVKQAIDTLGTTKVIISTNSNDADSLKSALVDFTESQLDSKPIECLGGIIAKASDGTMTFEIRSMHVLRSYCHIGVHYTESDILEKLFWCTQKDSIMF